MFGNFNRSLDDKNRVMIPSKLRLQLSEICYITRDLDNVLVLRDETNFKEWSTTLMSLNTLDKQARKFARVLLGRTSEVTIDKQGRIQFNQNIMTQTSLTKELVFIGVGNKIEIHSKEDFEKIQQEFEKTNSLDELANQLLNKGAKL
ncbi:division/cell wall cluster transcriptional repressor MraZ [Candidatus Mycoplasma mahonii]|uniref:division/cell wall cluster transcriptional repressor MraZ n=1 Tax=Candidatus Mycoplasma mahonii TaxID=3004105 RepID=UPI0026F0DF17|nr:division/cell wall cluster transcriptional repressor MraZ [Candidatus Mycoplasma mahonii]WKX02739.1 division/cell wall cluster transcriptional repressor MraZ [Candidatus Mycoplasma mahonii]